MDRSEEQALVHELVRMDDGAWERFCKEYSAPLLGFVQLCFGCGRETSEEIVQMVFIRCVRSIRTFDPSRGRLFQWLKAVARNEAHTALSGRGGGRADMPLSAVPESVLSQLAAAINHRPLPEELLARKDTQVLIRECLAELNTRYRQVLLSKYVDGLKVAEIAARQGESEKAVESLLSRAREAFKVVLLAKVTSGQLPRSEMLE
jgi:RNA polymerase sigma-70 factor (ECF subfamily)